MEKKWLCEILHMACLLSSDYSIEISLQTLIKHALPAKVRVINRYSANHHSTRKRQEWGGGRSIKKVVCERVQEHEILYTTIP